MKCFRCGQTEELSPASTKFANQHASVEGEPVSDMMLIDTKPENDSDDSDVEVDFARYLPLCNECYDALTDDENGDEMTTLESNWANEANKSEFNS